MTSPIPTDTPPAVPPTVPPAVPPTAPPAVSLLARLGARVRETAAVAGNAGRTLRLVADLNRVLLTALVGCQVLDALGAVAVAWVGKHIVDAVVTGLHHGTPRAALTWVVAEFALVAARSLVSQVSSHASLVLRSELGLRINLLILERAADVGYPRFEDPDFNNRMTQARREASSRPLDLVSQLLALVRHGVTLVGYGALLVGLGPWALLALVVTAVPPFLAEARYGSAQFALQRTRTQRNRQAFYLESVLTTEASVKEIKLLALARWLIGRYRAVHEGYHVEETALSLSRARSAFLLGLVSTLAFYGTYLAIVNRAVAGAITLGAMTLYLMVLRQGQSSLQGALSAVARIHEDNLFMANLFEFLAEPADDPHQDLPPSDPETAPEVRFEHVTYRYPGSTRDAVTDVSFTLAAGQTVALVGRNGAGKTTLVKLLTGLYRPTGGRILIDGVDTATLSTAALRQRVGVVFQDFVRFQFSAADNVGVGWLPSREDRRAVEGAITDAGAQEVIQRLPHGLDTPLGRAFGGDDLSVGQWQRVALARAFMRRSRMMVLDEPTAALDAEAEHEVFLRLSALKAGRTALLITHRFSTVRIADRIVVVEGGRVVEEGTHTELMALDGRYAGMFKLQAQGYADDPAQPEA